VEKTKNVNKIKLNRSQIEDVLRRRRRRRNE